MERSCLSGGASPSCRGPAGRGWAVVADAGGARAPPLGGPWVTMSASASVGGPVPPPPPGPAASLPPGSAARALHVELPSQQVTPRAHGARGLGGGGRAAREEAGGGRARGRRADLVPAGRRGEVPGEISGSRDLRMGSGGRRRGAEAPGDPRVPGAIPLLETGCREAGREAGRDPVEVPGGPGRVRFSPLGVGAVGIPLRGPSSSPLRGRGPGKPGCSTRDGESAFPFSTHLRRNHFVLFPTGEVELHGF